jgi:hypothetical protein
MVVFIGSGADPFAVLAASSQTLGVSGTTLTISSVDFQGGGTIVFGFCRANAAGDAATVSNVTIDGASATLVANASGGSVGADAHMYYRTGVDAGTGDIVITFNVSKVWTVVYGIYLVGTRTLENSDTTNATATSFTDTVDVAAGGVVISTYYQNTNNSTSAFAAGVDQDVRTTLLPTARPSSAGSREYPSGATPASVSSTVVTSGLHRAVTASFS